jgi:hypothetical protein
MSTTKYNRWEQDCWVRGGNRLMLPPQQTNDFDFFPRKLLPYAPQLEEQLGATKLRQVQLQNLFNYLRFTEQLELKSINHVGNQVALGEWPVPVSTDLRSRAFLLVRDEAHHAAVSDDIKQQLAQLTGVEPLAGLEPQFATSLRRIGELAGRELVPVVEMAFATISETLISGSLSQIPRDPAVMPLIRDYAAKHAADEARHLTYFSDLFTAWWPQLPIATRRQVGPFLPELCEAFLSPDWPSQIQILESIGVSSGTARAWIEEAFPASEFYIAARRPLQITLQLFKRVGVMEDHQTHDAFARRDWL